MNYRELNRPIRLEWAGWQTDTFRLGQMGWQISAEQDIQYNQIRLAINHPKMEVQGLTMVDTFYFRDISEGRVNSSLPVMLQFEIMGKQIYLKNMQDANVAMHPVDWRPQITEMNIQSLSDFANFSTAGIEMPKHEVYLHEANIDQILEMALVKQEPDQERIRQEMLRGQELRQMRMGTLHTELRLVA